MNLSCNIIILILFTLGSNLRRFVKCNLRPVKIVKYSHKLMPKTKISLEAGTCSLKQYVTRCPGGNAGESIKRMGELISA